MAQDCPKTALRRPRMAREGSKLAARWTKMAQDSSKTAQESQTWSPGVGTVWRGDPILARFWGRLGSFDQVLGQSGAVLGVSMGNVGAILALLWPFWSHLGRSCWAILAHHGASLGSSGQSWSHLGPPEVIMRCLGGSKSMILPR